MGASNARLTPMRYHMRVPYWIASGCWPILTRRVPWLACPEVPSVNSTRPTFSGAQMSLASSSRRAALTAGPSKPL